MRVHVCACMCVEGCLLARVRVCVRHVLACAFACACVFFARSRFGARLAACELWTALFARPWKVNGKPQKLRHLARDILKLRRAPAIEIRTRAHTHAHRRSRSHTRPCALVWAHAPHSNLVRAATARTRMRRRRCTCTCIGAMRSTGTLLRGTRRPKAAERMAEGNCQWQRFASCQLPEEQLHGYKLS